MIEFIAYTQRYLPTLLPGAMVALEVTLICIPLFTIIGLVVALMRLSRLAPVRAFATAFVEFIRGTPLLMQVFWIFYALPFLGIRLPPIPAGVAALSINFGAYASEVFRTGILAIPVGQREAAIVLGMPSMLIMRRIILPQTVRIVLPPLANFVVEMFRATSLLSLITIPELVLKALYLNDFTYAATSTWTIVAILYFAMSYPAGRLVRRLESALGYD